MNIKLKIPIPENANVYAENGDKAVDLLLYEVDQLEVLEEVKLESNAIHFHVKDGQFINKGDVIFSEGLLGHKIMVSDFNGIVEIKDNKCRILGQKKHIERRIHLNGIVGRIVPNRFIEIDCVVRSIKASYYKNIQTKLTDIIYLENKADINEKVVNFSSLQTTVFINDNLYIEELAKLIALGVKRIVVNGVFVNNLLSLKSEIDKLDGFCIVAGFGEFISKKLTLEDSSMNILWGKRGLQISSPVSIVPHRVFEHPYWGITGEYFKKNELVGELDYNHEVFEFYLKNIEKNG